MHSITTALICLILTSSIFAKDHYKRAPSGFTGVRGKKSISDSDYDSPDYAKDQDSALIVKPESFSVAASDEDGRPAVVEKRVVSGFVGTKPVYIQPWKGIYPDTFYKRARSGFMGMRGKKDDDLIGYDEKRMPSGFMGMRGKKKNYFSYQEPNKAFGNDAMNLLEIPGESGYDEKKRAPSGFFGMRGKKSPSGFFGLRGKKYQHDFRRKFVGVRGKKLFGTPNSEYFRDLDQDRLEPNLDMNQLMLLLNEQNELEDSRTPPTSNSSRNKR